LQRLFYKLQTDPVAVSTMELTQSFGWESRQVFEQQDVQELSRILMDKLEEKMKGTEAANVLAEMFVGKMKTYLRCIDVDYESSRVEDFWDLQLNVSGCKTLDDSFRDYVQVETLEGDNKYAAEGFGLQDAKKGVIFESFPQVLHLQLKRFEYDFVRDAMVKVNDRYEFPEVWDASPYLSETADRSESYIYRLHGVLVHSGDMNAGHYYAFLKPTRDSAFYKFDDDRVTRATPREAMDENFGGDYASNGPNGATKMQNPFTRQWSTKRSMSAYMLVYIRETRIDQILADSDTIQPPDHLPSRLAEERAALERKRKEREEAHLYMNVQVATESNFRSFQGFDLVDWKSTDQEEAVAPKVMRCKKAMTLAEFNEQMAQEIGTEADLIRPWVMVNRQNGTVRPDHPLNYSTMTLEEANAKFSTRAASFRLFIEETTRGTDGKAVWDARAVPSSPPAPDQKPIIVFLKHFDHQTQTLKGVGHTYMLPTQKVQDLADPILELMGWESGTTLKLFEEIKQNFIDVMKPKQTLGQSEIQDGDIVCFQQVMSADEVQKFQQSHPSAYVDAISFYDYLLNRIRVFFGPRPGTPQDISLEQEAGDFEIYLSRKDSYDTLAAKTAEHLSLLSKTEIDPTHLRFTTVNAQNGKPRGPVKRAPTITVHSILSGVGAGGYGNGYGYSNQSTDTLYYEVLEMSLTDLEQRKTIKISWLPEGVTKEEVYDCLVPKSGTFEDVLPVLQKKAKLPDEIIEQIRFYEAHSGKVYKNLELDTAVSSLNEFMQVYAERLPEEERDADKDAPPALIGCFHYDKEPAKPHGIPFIFNVIEVRVKQEVKTGD
jgi:ubiquitin carboxyl-terminal hydrolase 7